MIQFAKKLSQARKNEQSKLSRAWKATCSQMDEQGLRQMRERFHALFGDRNVNVRYIDQLLASRARNDRSLYGL